MAWMKDQLVIQEGANPYVSFGLNTNFEWKGFNLAFDFAGATMQSFLRECRIKNSVPEQWYFA